MKALVAFESKFLIPCKKLFRIFRFKLKKPAFIRAFRTRSRHPKTRKSSIQTSLKSVFHSFRQSRKMDRLLELSTVSSIERDRVFPSPITPAYAKLSKKYSRNQRSGGDSEVEDACRSFENYLVEMIVEEGKMEDLMVIEELLYCWKNLRCPIFTNLVCRFYAELCKDLFGPDNTEDDNA